MSRQNSRAEELQERLLRFSTAVIGISGRLPRTAQGRHMSSQMLRSGTAAAANYAEARAAESRSDFIHKLRVVLKELNETAVWIELSVRSSLLSPEIASWVLTENQELCRILAASVRTARAGEHVGSRN